MFRRKCVLLGHSATPIWMPFGLKKHKFLSICSGYGLADRDPLGTGAHPFARGDEFQTGIGASLGLNGIVAICE